ncbi:hypothetical protein [Streptomyces sp. JNUCC 63]
MRVLNSVKALEEDIDTTHCDAVAFCDTRVGEPLAAQPNRRGWAAFTGHFTGRVC